MESEAPIGEIRRDFRRWHKIVLILLALPFGIFLLGNLGLASPWGKRWVAGKIQNQTGLETRIAGASWSPWNGASVSRLEILQPVALRAVVKEPLFKCASVRVTPVWQAWIRGRLAVRDIELDSPEILLPLEVISSLAGSPPTHAPGAPPVATGPPVVPTPPPPPSVAQPTPSPPVAVDSKPKAPPPQPTGWLRLKNASVSIIHAGSGRTLLAISKTSGSIPISGNPAESSLHIGGISVFGHPGVAELTPKLDWTSPLLSLKPLDLSYGGYRFVFAAKIAGFSGLPLQIEAQLPSQPLASFALPFQGKAAAESIVANARFRGLLLAPGSWQGDLLAEAVAPTIRIGGHDAKFDKASMVSILRGGVLSCVDARMVGDDLSLLGNATVLADGRLAGAARVVATPESAAAIASRSFPLLQGAPSLTPLSTPQRAAFDVAAFGNISQIFLRLGKDGPVINLNP